MKTISKLVMTLLLSTSLTLSAADYYWSAETGTWGSSLSVWSNDPSGAPLITTPVTISNADNVYFSANGVTAGTVTVTGSQSFTNLTINRAGLMLTGGTLAGNIIVNASTTINSYVNITALTFVTADNQILTLGGGGVINAPGFHTYGAKGSTSSLILNTGVYAFNGGYLNIGNPNTGVGGLTVNGGASFTSNNLTWLGYGGSGFATLDGGLWNNPSGMVIGRGNTGKLVVNSGTLNVTGGNSLNVGWNGKGTMDVTGGVVNADQLSIGANTKSVTDTGTMTITGGVVNAGTVNFGWGYGGSGYTSNAGNGTLLLKDGRLNVGSGGLIKTGSAAYTVNIILSGGTLGATADFTVDAALPLTLSGATGVTFDTNGKKITVESTLSGNGKFTKAGAGTLLLSGANTYNGDAVISAGTLEVGATGALTLGELTFVLDGASNGLLDIKTGGAVTLGGLAFNTSAATLTDGKTWNLIDGAFTAANGFGIVGFTNSGGIWTDATQQFSFDQSSGILTYTATIPEPSALALMVTGGALLLFLRRKR